MRKTDTSSYMYHGDILKNEIYLLKYQQIIWIKGHHRLCVDN